jgi:uncharacterized protein (TIGR01777 family)
MSERIVVTGGSGYLGSALVRRLAERGKEVVVLSRGSRPPEVLAGVPGVSIARWAGVEEPPGAEWEASLDGAAAVVHLAGEQAVGRRYTEGVKRGILESRVKSAEALVGAIARARTRPSVLVSASGVGYYGGRSDGALLDESAPAGQDFLARVCVAWEGAVRAAGALGVRSASLRLGVILGRGGGALATMALPFKLFVGGPLGGGRQPFAWIHLEDAVRAFERVLDDPSLSGPVNVVAPELVTQGELSRALGRALGRPALMPAPSFALKALFGEGSAPILEGQRAVPRKLEAAGFEFRYPKLEAALAQAVG